MSPQAPQAPEARTRLVKLIHVARRELGLDEPTYRAMLHNVGGAPSTTDLGLPALKRVVEHCKRLGFVVKGGVAPGRAPRRQDTSLQGSKARALWLFLHHLGAVRDPSEAALAAYCRRIAGVDDLHWADAGAMHRLIETQKKWARRVLPEPMAALLAELAAHHPRRAAAATAALQQGDGFEVQVRVWARLSLALGRELPPGLAAAFLAEQEAQEVQKSQGGQSAAPPAPGA